MHTLLRLYRFRLIRTKIGDVVGQSGKVINAIIEETGVKIDITDEGAGISMRHR